MVLSAFTRHDELRHESDSLRNVSFPPKRLSRFESSTACRFVKPVMLIGSEWVRVMAHGCSHRGVSGAASVLYLLEYSPCRQRSNAY